MSDSNSSGFGEVVALTLGVSAAGLAAWWLIMKAPRLLAARRAELNSPPRGTVRPLAEGVIKKCSCGRTYTKAQWKKLPFVGYQKYEWGEVQEMRNCVCGSTMVIVIIEGDPED